LISEVNTLKESTAASETKYLEQISSMEKELETSNSALQQESQEKILYKNNSLLYNRNILKMKQNDQLNQMNLFNKLKMNCNELNLN